MPKTRSSATPPETFIPVRRAMARRICCRLESSARTSSIPLENCTSARRGCVLAGAEDNGVEAIGAGIALFPGAEVLSPGVMGDGWAGG